MIALNEKFQTQDALKRQTIRESKSSSKGTNDTEMCQQTKEKLPWE